MHNYYLAPEVHGGLVEKQLVFADLRRGLYFALSEPQTEMLDQQIRKGYARHNRWAGEVLKALEKEGLVTCYSTSGRPLRCEPAPITVPDTAVPSSRNDTNIIKLRFRDAAAIASARIITRVNISCGLLNKRKKWTINQRPITISSLPDSDLLNKLATIYSTWDPLLFRKDSCLSRSLTIRRFLLYHRISAKLVIGVRLVPFTAHAWIQLGTIVVNDAVDHVRSFTPIMEL